MTTTELPTIANPAPKARKQTDEPVVIPTDAEQETSELEMEYEHYFSMADEMLRGIVAAKRNPNFAETTFFKGRCGWDERTQQLQINRMASVLRFKAIAGSAAERIAAGAEQVKAAEILESEGPRLEAAIAKLQEQKDALERNSTRADRVVEQIGIAVESLRSVDVLRPDLRAKHEGLRRQFAESDWTRLGAVGIEVSFRKQMLAPVEDQRKFIEALGIHFSDCRKYNTSLQRYEIDAEPWEARKRIMRCELMEFQDEFDRLTKLKAEQMASLEPLLDHYISEEK